MDGILIIDKPEGITSHDVVARVRRILKTKRVGHTGTLDPFATGVMVVLVGKATRLAQFLDKDEKEYEAMLKFGWGTDTGDKTGTASGEPMPGPEVAARLCDIEWSGILNSFLGESEQTPPMYSAKKVDGKKLYQLARSGQTIDRKPVRINITGLELIEVRSDEVALSVACSAGTYVRTLAEDIARSAGLKAHLTALRRTRAGRFGISNALTLDQLGEMEDPGSALLPVEDAVPYLPELILSDERLEKTRNGLSTRVGLGTFTAGVPIRIVSEDGELAAIGFYDEAENSVRPKVVLI